MPLRVLKELRGRTLIPICPEQLGGLPTPRLRAQLVGGDGLMVLKGRARVVNEKGEDVTVNFIRGARQAMRVARLVGARQAYLKSRSPSCGFGAVTIDGHLRLGMGVAAAALHRLGVEIREV